VIQKRKKLCNVKCDDAGVTLLEPPYSNEIRKVYLSINGRPLPNASKLIGIQETVSSHLKLKPIADNFLNELACGIE